MLELLCCDTQFTRIEGIGVDALISENNVTLSVSTSRSTAAIVAYRPAPPRVLNAALR
jgi:hypothetical protein